MECYVVESHPKTRRPGYSCPLVGQVTKPFSWSKESEQQASKRQKKEGARRAGDAGSKFDFSLSSSLILKE